MAAVMAAASILSGRILANRGGRLPTMAAGVALAAGGLLVSTLTIDSALLPVLGAFAVVGIGSGLVNAPITQAAVSGMPPSQAGVAAGIASTSRQVGSSLGVAVVGSILAGRLHGPARTGFVAASHPAWFVLAGCGAMVFLLGLVTTTRWAQGTAVRTAALFTPAGEKAGQTGGPRQAVGDDERPDAA
jgi:MFS family permease